MNDTPQYQQQMNRVLRWFQRFKSISEGGEGESFTKSNDDEIFAFFLNCYHLKDWIKNDPASGDLKDLVEPYINKSQALSICADLCNGLKHFKRDPSRVRKNAEFGPKTETISLGKDSASIAISYTIITDSGTFDAFEIARQCLTDWETFFLRNKGST